MQMAHRSTSSSTHPVLKTVHKTFKTPRLDKNKLKLNQDKTKFLLIAWQYHRSKFQSNFPMDILSRNISPTPSAQIWV